MRKHFICRTVADAGPIVAVVEVVVETVEARHKSHLARTPISALKQLRIAAAVPRRSSVGYSTAVVAPVDSHCTHHNSPEVAAVEVDRIGPHV